MWVRCGQFAASEVTQAIVSLPANQIGRRRVECRDRGDAREREEVEAGV